MEKCTTNRLPSSQQHLAMYLLADVWKGRRRSLYKLE